MTREQASDYIRNSNGRWFTVRFIRRDGKMRTMLARLGVTKHLTGGTLGYDPADYNLITVFDRHAPRKDSTERGAYRSVPLDRLTAVKVKGKWTKVTEG